MRKFSERLNILQIWCVCIVTLVVIIILFAFAIVHAANEQEARLWLANMETKYNERCYQNTLIDWETGVNMTDELADISKEQSRNTTEMNIRIQQDILKKFPMWKEFGDKRLKRAFRVLARSGPAGMPVDRVESMNKMSGQMSHSYSTATVCKFEESDTCNLTLNDIEGIMASSKDVDELAHYFNSWHNKMSDLVTPKYYREFINYLNEYANANGLEWYTHSWLSPYDEETEEWTFETFKNDIVKLENEIQDLYEILHAYVRMKLRKIPEYRDFIDRCGYIPAHLTGNMWAQEWTAVEKFTKPFPNTTAVDATDAMKRKGYTPLKMFQEADKFYQELGLPKMTEKFWKYSVLEKPADGRDITCHPTAWDMCSGKGNDDFRIRFCTKVNQYDFYVAHHEMGHIAYFMQYTDLEFPFRQGANPGFHEAIGDAIALAVTTPQHLQCKLDLDLGFPESFCKGAKESFNVTEADLNYLYLVALDKLVFFPFSTAVDRWRWAAIENLFPPEKYNTKWWEYKRMYQGVVPPADRNASHYFDPAGKYHIVNNIDYFRYFVANILQFQFYEAMCIAAKEFDPKDPNSKPLFQCDFSGSKEAGKLIGDMMKMGFSRGWRDALKAMTGTKRMSVTSFKNYFQPILDYMEKEVLATGNIVGFGSSCEHAEERKKRRKSGDPKWDVIN